MKDWKSRNHNGRIKLKYQTRDINFQQHGASRNEGVMKYNRD